VHVVQAHVSQGRILFLGTQGDGLGITDASNGARWLPCGSTKFPIETNRECRQCDQPVERTPEKRRKADCKHAAWRRLVSPHDDQCHAHDIHNRRYEEGDHAN
jgi:hypothetical protein